MAHVQTQVARDRQRWALAAAALERDGRRAWEHGRMVRQAERAERRAMSHADRAMNHADHAERLRTRLIEFETGE
jgi:hypothetical protein